MLKLILFIFQSDYPICQRSHKNCLVGLKEIQFIPEWSHNTQECTQHIPSQLSVLPDWRSLTLKFQNLFSGKFFARNLQPQITVIGFISTGFLLKCQWMLDHSLFKMRNGKALPLGDFPTCLKEHMPIRSVEGTFQSYHWNPNRSEVCHILKKNTTPSNTVKD